MWRGQGPACCTHWNLYWAGVEGTGVCLLHSLESVVALLVEDGQPLDEEGNLGKAAQHPAGQCGLGGAEIEG